MDILHFSLILIDVYRYVDVAGIMAGIFFYKRLSPLYRSLLCYLALMFFVDRLSAYIIYFIPSNHVVLPIYALLELLFFTWFYNYRLFTKPRLYLLLLGGLGSVYIVWELIFDFVINYKGTQGFQPYCKVVDNFIIIIFALNFLYKKMTRFTETRLDNLWLNLSALVFYTFTLIIFLPFNFLVNADSESKFYFWTLNVVLVLFFYGFIGTRIFLFGYRSTRAQRPVTHAGAKAGGTLLKRITHTIASGRAPIFKK